MADILCPACGKSNPEALEICQYCGTLLKNRGTEPLAPIHPGEAPTLKKTAELERTLPGWLRDIRKGGGAGSSTDEPAKDAMPEPPKPPAPKPANPVTQGESPLDFLAGLSKDSDEEEEVPDWLAGLKSSLPGGPVPSPEPTTAQPQTGQPSEEPADWLAGLQGETRFEPATPSPAEQIPVSSSEFDRSGVATPQPEETPSPTPPASPDWLNALQGSDESLRAAQTAPLAAPPPEDFPPIQGLPDWLSGLVGGPDDTPPPASAPASNDLPGWPHAQEASEPAAQPAPEVPASPTTTPDWLSSAAPAPDASASAGSVPDWLSSSAAASPTESAPAGGDMPDWLAGLGGGAPAASGPSEPSEPAEVPPATGMDVPDWLAGLGGGAPAASGPSEPSEPAEVPPATGMDVPDWLAGLGGGAPAVAAGPSGPSEPAAFTPPAETAPATGADVPDWMAAKSSSPSDEPNASNAFGTGSLPELGTLGGTGGLPEWMAGLSIGGAAGRSPAMQQPEPDQASPNVPKEGAGVPAFDWPDASAGAGPASTSQPEASGNSAQDPAQQPASPVPAAESEHNLDAILSMDMPDWLSGFAPTESEPITQPRDKQAPGLPGGNISPADLPSWVQAMRPMESVVTAGTEGGQDDQNIEHEGPLAGLRSVLPAQPGGFAPHKPKAYSIKLQVDATQQSQAAWLEKLIASEAESQPVALPKRVVTVRPLRWAIAVLLLLAVLIPALFPPDLLASIFPAPAAVPEVADFHKVIANLPASAPVLVVFDYQPGYAGEIEQAAGPAIDDLISKRARLALVSTSPLGSMLSRRLMSQPQHAYGPENYADLGYLPGGTAGIQVFANNPQIVGNDLRSGDLWKLPALAGVNTFSDFGAVLVLTDNPDTGRQWIEQTSQLLQIEGAAMPPMLMVISAQAEPMIEPYYNSKQVAGLVSGLAGGAMYEGLIQHPGQAGAYWGSYGAGTIAAELLIVIGGAWALFENLRARRTEQQETEEDEA